MARVSGTGPFEMTVGSPAARAAAWPGEVGEFIGTGFPGAPIGAAASGVVAATGLAASDAAGAEGVIGGALDDDALISGCDGAAGLDCAWAANGADSATTSAADIKS